IEVWNYLSRELVFSRELPSEEVRCIAYSPDGAFLASGLENSTIIVINGHTGVEPVRLGAALAAVHFDTGRIHHAVVDAIRVEVSVQPEAITSSFVTTAHRGVRREMEALFGFGDLILQPRQIAGGHGAQPGLLAEADGEGKLPLGIAQLK